MHLNEYSHRYRVVILSSVILLALIFGAMYILSNQKTRTSDKPSTQQIGDKFATPIPIPTESLTLPPLISDDAVPDAPPTPIPQPGDIILEGIAVKNFRENAVKITETQDVVISETDDYQIVFYDSTQDFKIILLGSDVVKARKDAEEMFLTKLRIDKDNACRLYVSEFVNSSVHNQYSGTTLPLSFCYDE